MTDTPTTSSTPAAAIDRGASSTPAAARTSSPAPAARTSGPGQAEKDAAGVPRWNAPADPDGSIARWEAQQRARHGHPDPAAPAKPDQAKPDRAADTVKIGNTTVTEAELSEFLTNKAARESGRLQAPTSPDGYKIQTSPDFKPPNGVEFSIDENDPSFGLLKSWACRNQIPQSELSALVDIYGGKITADLAAGKAAHEYQVGLLGGSGPGRVDAMARWLKGMIGDQGAI
jgi:hypothetical protein